MKSNLHETDSQSFASPILIKIGQISYGVYLWQGLFLGEQIPNLKFIRTFPIGLILTFAFATLSYIYVEKPLLQLKDRKFHRV